MLFRNRREAGRALAEALAAYAGRDDVVVLALPRGGVPVGFEVATRLAAPLDVFVVRKLGVPGHEELAMGAIASGGIRVDNEELRRMVTIQEAVIERVAERELAELTRREHAYRGDRPPLDARGKIAIVVDDGLATGSTMRAAVAGLRKREPAGIIVAVPVAPRAARDELAAVADAMVCLTTPEPFRGVGLWYEDFSQTTDEEVRALLREADRVFARQRTQPATGAETESS